VTLQYSLLLSVWVDPSAEHTFADAVAEQASMGTPLSLGRSEPIRRKAGRKSWPQLETQWASSTATRISRPAEVEVRHMYIDRYCIYTTYIHIYICIYIYI